ncbi:hypothetical protein KRX54_07325, partial [Actinomycetaceae bacterium TAE3-ERU4]|nr:hypothetical protein [Actinomycetaceae bacterium TAE3-ERU4]
SETTKALYGAMQKMLKDVGINLIIDQKKPTDFASTMKNKDFDMVLNGFRQTNPFGMADLGQIYKSDSTLSKTGLGSPEINAMIEKSTRADNEADSIKYGNEAEKAALAQVGWLPLYMGPSMVATREGLANMGAMGYTVMPREMIGWKK